MPILVQEDLNIRRRSVMSSTNNHETGYGLISRCAARITDMATQIQRSHTMGVPHGEHDEPWTLGFHRVVDRIYMPVIPAGYARKVAAVFKECDRIKRSRVERARDFSRS